MTRSVSRRSFLQVAATGAITAGLPSRLGSGTAYARSQAGPPAWSLNATIIEACSCTMFCPCYFSTVPSAHGHGSMAEHYCRFNMGYRVNRGTFGSVDLAGIKFWAAGDLGADFSKGAEWVEFTFEPSVTKAQREAIAAIAPHVYPVTWKAFTVGKDAVVDWTATPERAEARLDGGKAAHVVLKRNPGMTAEPTVITNLRYFGAPRNTGFILMPNEINAYRVGAKPFEYKGTNGFMITYDIKSTDVKKA
jgi:hypothetical protein